MLIAVGICVAGKVEPTRCPLLTKVLRFEETIDDGFVVLRILLEGFDFLDGGRQSNEIEIETTEKHSRFGLR